MKEVESYIESVAEPLKPIVIELRRLVREQQPPLRESIKWQVPTYSRNGNVCSIMAHKNHVNLQLFQGAHLACVDQLDGIGDAMRHLKFYQPGEIDAARVAAVLKQAISHDEAEAD